MSISSVTQGRFCLTVLLFVASCGALRLDDVVEQGTICGSIRIHMDRHISELENCRVVEGSLYISHSFETANTSFPKLHEITDTLLLFYIRGLRSLGQLFPNLAVIGGQTLFYGYSFVALYLPNLEEIGLPNLTVIRNGAVRIEENPRLCYIDTVDWSRITQGVSADENYFKNNTAGCLDICPSQCDITDGVKRCWNAEHCQKMLSCPPECKTGFCHGDVCCHSQCIGGCTGPLASQCTSCNAVIDSPDHSQGTCLQKCPSGLYLYRNRTCLTADQCINFSDYKSGGESCDDSDCMKLVAVTGEDLDQTLVCSEGCPAGYQPDSNDETRCVSCSNGVCPKVCTGMTVDSLKHAKELKDCTSINGSLRFRLRNCFDEDKLEEYLGKITEVTGYIDVSDSYGLHSLRMLKGLRKLGGQQLFKNKYALHVFNNQNIRELLPEESMSRFELVRGSVLFQHNGKLNYDKIMEFLSQAGIEQNNNDGDISEETNGDKLTLQAQELRLHLNVKSSYTDFYWSAMHLTNPQDLIGYSLKWKEVSERSITVIPEDDICQDESWNSREVDCIYYKCSNETVAVFLSYLKPATQYAVYVRAVTVSAESALSNVVYFRTLAEVPSVPLNVKVKAQTPGALHVAWDPPAHPNGIFIKYRLTYTHIPIRPEEYGKRDYCTNPLLEIEKEKQSESTNCCACAESSTDAYDFLEKVQNTVYVKRKDNKKKSKNRRDSPINENKDRRTYILYVYDEERTITNLGNYEEYSIKVQACHNEAPNKEIVCSDSVVVSGKTLPDASNDAIPKVSLERMTDGVELKWQDPPNPNGVILTYEVEYVAGHMDQSENVCIPNDKVGDNEYELTSLTPGNYMIRIRATSLAGVGPWTSYAHFTV